MTSKESYESLLCSEVVAVCNELGHKNTINNKYVLNKKESSNCIRDLIRFLRNDDNRFAVRRQMGVSNVVKSDLIPIVEEYSVNDISLFDKVLRLLVDITNPTILHFKEKTPKDKLELNKFLELQSFLYSYKLSFGCHKKFWSVLAKHMTRILELDEEKRQIEDSLMLERILILIRNVLHIPLDTDSAKVTEDDMNPHDRILEVMHSSGINDLIIFLSSSGEHQELCFHLIEIISLMFREQNAEFIALSVSDDQQNGVIEDKRTAYEREQDSKELKELRSRDRSTSLKSRPTNYNRFNGAAFYVKNVKSISDRDLICHKAPENLDEISFDNNKEIKRKARNRKPMIDNRSNSTSTGAQVIHRSTFKIRKLLHGFCVDFLKNCYNQFMNLIVNNLRRNLSQENDETYYLWSIQFFMEFDRCNPKTSDYSFVEQTMSVSSFHYLHTQIEHYLDHMKTQKEDLTLWSKRLHFGLRAYRELLFSLGYLDSLNDEKARKMGELIKNDIFYESEYRDLLLHLLHDYNEVKMSKAFLKDLIETNHIFLKMIEIYCKKNTNLIIREKVRKRKKRKSSKKKNQNKKTTPPEEIWIEIMSTVSETLVGSAELPSPIEDASVRAFDPFSDKTTDEQKMDVLRRVNNFLKQKLVPQAVALYRDARNVWSGDEDNAFGNHDIPPEDELLSLNQVLMTDFPDEPLDEEQNEEEGDDEEETEIVEKRSMIREREFVFIEAVNKYSHPIVIKNYALLLRSYDTNSSQTNHCIVKMLHRIALDCKMHCMLFQASIFRTFQRILRDSSVNSPTIQELSKFVKYIIAKFLIVAEKNPKLFMELLFWKNCREAYEIEEGYEQREGKTTKKGNEDDVVVNELVEDFNDNQLFDEDNEQTNEDMQEVNQIIDEDNEKTDENKDETNEDVNEINEDVNEINEDVNEINEDVNEINEDMNEINEDVNEINEDVNEITEDANEINEDMNEINEDVNEINEDLNEINEDEEVVNKDEEVIDKNQVLDEEEIIHKKKKKRKMIIDEDESDVEDEVVNEIVNENAFSEEEEVVHKNKKRRKIIIEDDSD